MEENITPAVNAADTMEQREKRAQSKGFLFGLLIGMAAVVLSILLFLGIKYLLVGRNSIVNDGVISKINLITERVNDKFYKYSDDVGTENMREGIYRGIMNSLGDPYSEYYTKTEFEEEMNYDEGVSYGIGCHVSIDKETDMPYIVDVIAGSPAENAGVKSGDIIYKVEGKETIGLSLSRVVKMIKGLEGTTVHVTFYREGEPDYLEMDIERSSQIDTDTVTYGTLKEDERVGYLAITQFSEITVSQFEEGLSELRKKDIKGLIIDLRNNPGGSLDAVVNVARQILPAGTIVYIDNGRGKRNDFLCDGNTPLDIPLVVLVNENSASASEILAGAIQDYNVGTLLGTTTYGKGIVQSLYELPDGSAIKMTTSAYFTPSGRNIHGSGIEPDVILEYDYETALDSGEDNQVNAAVDILQQKMGD